MIELLDKASKLASEILRHEEVLVVTHIDADGITAGAIAYQSLLRAGIEARVEFIKQLDAAAIEKIKDENVFVWFTDLGSGQLGMLDGMDFVITDHHLPAATHERQLNPHDFGIDGSIELSGAGATFLVASRLRRKRTLFDYCDTNLDLVNLAIVGAVGDLQDSRDCRLVGINRKLAERAAAEGMLRVERDLRLFGKQTRPVAKMLEYSLDPIIPGVSGSEKGSVAFLRSLGIDPWKKWIDLSIDEKRRVVSALVRICVEAGMPVSQIFRLVGECYILLNQPEASEKRDAMEFSTLLNATARYGEADVGLGVCMGDEDAFRRARTLLQNHRRNLSAGLRLVDAIGIEEMENLQYFHAQDEIPDTIIGIVAGMSFHKGNFDKPIVAFAESDNGIKVSARGTYRLVEAGLNLAEAMKIAAEKVGGSGGGHRIAAGATIPEGTEEEFLRILDELIGEQLKSGKSLSK